MSVLHMTALALSRAILSRQISVSEVTRELFSGIARTEGKLHAYLDVDADHALKQADLLQRRIDGGELCSPLAGIPIALKDNICTDHLKTTCASRMLADFRPPYRAAVVDRLRCDGLTVYGKLNMDEFAMGSTTETSYFGATANPWDVTRVPGGSSGGAAAAVAAGSAICALGSDTGGSIRQPASHCGVTGFKPTYGTVSRYGLIAYASSMDQIGPIARDAADCAAIMDIIRGQDARDSTSISSGERSYLSALNGDIRGLRIGIPREFRMENASSDVWNRVLEMARQLEKMGAIVQECNFPLINKALACYYILAAAEAASNLARCQLNCTVFGKERLYNLDDFPFTARTRWRLSQVSCGKVRAAGQRNRSRYDNLVYIIIVKCCLKGGKSFGITQRLYVYRRNSVLNRIICRRSAKSCANAQERK